MRVFLAGMLAFVVMDTIWLGFVATDFYRRQLSDIAYTGPDGSLAPIWAAAVPVYFLVVLGVQWFVHPRARGRGFGPAAGWGAVFGVISFGVYDLTNLAIVRGFSTTMALVDITWGAVVCSTVAVAMQMASSTRHSVQDGSDGRPI